METLNMTPVMYKGKGTPNGNNFSITIMVGDKRLNGWGFNGGYDRVNQCYAPASMKISGVFRENFSQSGEGVLWGNLMLALGEWGFQESPRKGVWVQGVKPSEYWKA